MRGRRRMLRDLDRDMQDHIEIETRDDLERGRSWLLTRVMGSLLYDVKPNNIPTLVEVAITLRVAALLACLVPTLKAADVQPAVELRCR